MEQIAPITKEEFLKAYDEYADMLFRFAFVKTSDREISKDMVQDTFVKTFEYLQKGEEVNNLKSFLYQVLRNIVIDYYRKKKSFSLDEQMENGFDIFETNKESKIFENAEEKEAIRMLNSLEDVYKETLVLRFVQDMSVNEIGELLGVSPNVVSVRISRGLEKLKWLMGTKK